jgi:alpha-mannosidase
VKKVVFHLLGNAHLDPVWLWDWREGLNEGITTIRTILELMDEDPRMTFIRGESLIYQHLEREDPETFARVKALVEEGRWDVIGGTFIQPDTNLPATETLARQFTVAQAYFRRAFGRTPEAAWAADSFGHSAGYPEILAAAGMKYFAFTRPEERYVHLDHPAFWWESASGARILSYRPTFGWYGTERDEVFRRFDGYLTANEKFAAKNVGCFYGLGNHGGGPSRRQLDEIRRWADKHPQVEVVHSTLHRFFEALVQEESERASRYPVHRGELNFCLRGCYSSVAKFKFPYRRTESRLVRAEKTDAIIAAGLGRTTGELDAAWRSVLFNTFHDILPGTSIERAYEEQLAWLGAAYHDAQRVEFEALNALAWQVDTSVPKPGADRPSRVPFLVWNPHPHEYAGPVELEASLDYRPLWQYEHRFDEVPVELFGPKGTAIPFQIVRTEHSAMKDLPWRKRVIFQAKLPPMSWSIYHVGLAEKMKPVRVSGAASGRASGTIRNGFYRISARPGSTALQVFYKEKPLFKGAGFSVINVRDLWGSWGGGSDDREALTLNTPQERWRIDAVELLEAGPERASVWVRFGGKRSRIELTLSLVRGREVVDVAARVLWNERSSRLKLVFPVGDKAEFEVPGGVAQRGDCGEAPGGRWVRMLGRGAKFGFASDAIYGFNLRKGELLATVVRASRYANSDETPAEKEQWRPAVDAGELTFNLLLTTDTAALPRLALELEQPLVAQSVPPHPGALPKSGSFLSLAPSNVHLLALKPAEDGQGWIVRLQEIAGKAATVRGRWLGETLSFGRIRPRSVNSWRVTREDGAWTARRTDVQERDVAG